MGYYASADADRDRSQLIISRKDSMKNILDALLNWAGTQWTVFDMGIAADKNTNACFWLSVVAGWSRLPLIRYQDKILDDLSCAVHELNPVPLAHLQVRQRFGMDTIGQLANQLRQLVAGEHGAMMARQCVWQLAFAGLQLAGTNQYPSDSASFKKWLSRVATSEFADELVLSATSQLLRICIRTVPHTPEGSMQDWKITEHPCAALRSSEAYDESMIITLGNNDVHYVCLHAHVN